MNTRILVSTMFLLTIMVCCTGKKLKPCSADPEDLTIQAFVRDSTTLPLSIVPDNLLLSSDSMWECVGEALSSDDISRLIKSKINAIFPNDVTIGIKDLEKNYIPNMNVYLIGRFNNAAEYDSFILKVTSKKEKSCSFYLITSIAGKALTATYIGFASNNSHSNRLTTFERISTNSFAVHFTRELSHGCDVLASENSRNYDNRVHTDIYQIDEYGNIAFIKRHDYRH